MRSRRRLAWVGALALTAGSLAGPGGLHAQVAVGDSLWTLGQTDEAVAAYRRAVDVDRNSVRANFRIAQTLAWSSDVDSALVFLTNARARVPEDVDLRFAQATYLSWARRFDEAMVQYDSILALQPGEASAYVQVAKARTLSWAGDFEGASAGYRAALESQPGNRDARFGLAQVSAWQGDLDGALTGYTELLEDDPTETRLLVALAQVRLWQGRPGTAADHLDAIVPADTTQADVRTVRRSVRDALALTTAASASWSDDADGNANAWQTLTVRGVVGDANTLTFEAGQLGADDTFRESRRLSLALTWSRPVARGNVTAQLGMRRLDPAVPSPDRPAPDTRDVITGRVSLAQRILPSLTVTLGAARWPFDEVASLTPLELDVTQADATVEWRAHRRLGLSAGISRLGFSDDNARVGTWGRAVVRLPGGFQVGAYATRFTWEFDAPRYFSPETFASAEATLGWGRDRTNWNIWVGGGLGAQRIADADAQRQWHIDARASRRIRERWWIEASAGQSTSAAANAIGAFRYDVVTIGIRKIW